MDEYIKRKDVVNCLWANCDESGSANVPDMEAIPAADVQPVVYGKWVPDYDYAEYDFDGETPLSEPRKFQDGWQCSLCGGYMTSETNFCPNCGADMRPRRAEDQSPELKET